MGIYINGIEMPRNNYIKLTLYPNGDYVSRTYDFQTGEILDEHCEFEAITEVSKPHGRLIDADKLKQWFFRPYSNEESYVNLDVAKAIEHAPTVIEGEVGE